MAGPRTRRDAVPPCLGVRLGHLPVHAGLELVRQDLAALPCARDFSEPVEAVVLGADQQV